MSTKLDWVYQDHSGEYHAEYKDLVIRAIHDDSPANPFETDDGNWPMAVIVGRNSKPTIYDKIAGGHSPLMPLYRFNDAQLVHWQVHIAKLFNHTVRSLIECYLTDEPVGYCTDANVLRDAFDQAWDDWHYDKQFEVAEGLYKLIDIPCLRTTVHGYSQGDWADLLIVATPEAQKEFGCAEVKADDLEGQAKLYKAWAFGDVYGYQLARKVEDEDGEETLEDLDGDSSCWGYYGSDFDWSGLEDAAIEAAEGFVRVPDKETADA